MQAIPGYLIVFVGAGIGGMLRHAVNQAAVIFGWTFPWHTLLVNVSGCLLMGAVAGWFAFRGASGQDIQLFLTTGILGGFTTFSAFSLDAALLWERGQVLSAALYIGGSVVLSVACVFLGLALTRTQ
jgi:fluoride exporter